MADGSISRLAEPGVYLDMPMSDYIRDPGLSGSAFSMLLTEPAQWRWQRPDNPLFERPESRPQKRGTAAHTAILEGIEAYDERYAVEPSRADHPDALDTADDLKAWLRARDLKVSGAKAELIERVLQADADAPIWQTIVDDAIAGRILLSAHEDAYVRLLTKFVQAEPQFSALLTGGLPELTIIWEQDGTRFKARLDYLGPLGAVDLKTYGAGPRRGRSLRQHVVETIARECYDLQAVHNARAVEAAARLLMADDRYGIVGDKERADLAFALLRHHADECPFTWLFVRMGGAPAGIGLPLRRDSDLWQHSEDEIATAIATHDRFRRAYGAGLWMQSEGVVEIDHRDVPIWRLSEAY